MGILRKSGPMARISMTNGCSTRWESLRCATGCGYHSMDKARTYEELTFLSIISFGDAPCE